jgi:cell division septum initiation protein DivIVA
VRAQLQRFQQEARKYLEQQEALRKRLQGATEEERVRVRQQLQNLREQWLERARELRKQFRDRQSELIEKLPSHREVLESVRDAAKQSALEQLRDELKNQQQQGRDRRGQD